MSIPSGTFGHAGAVPVLPGVDACVAQGHTAADPGCVLSEGHTFASTQTAANANAANAALVARTGGNLSGGGATAKDTPVSGVRGGGGVGGGGSEKESGGKYGSYGNEGKERNRSVSPAARRAAVLEHHEMLVRRFQEEWEWVDDEGKD
eukprot:CAMPEP_0175076370 /NCGR_PEP_ID=MMETSP0052_2-20121109/22685_1 /TAXON_ID=51329 ORGANISM="Polytomella parva, Strain SAG 63-3" /NCGR_SAMPLE_ID=MMETSP0052_2 /ASSEMBLY_ACC=CAM_ASM_000194 /LENGTH=148 /DNA_ID=CAMNT_0016345493 /DNA_START=26 /DNA_END=474 /DNA_ORIENTATION=+